MIVLGYCCKWFSRTILPVVFIQLLFSWELRAQNKSEYEGAYTLKGDSIPGKCVYEFELINGDTVKQGRFSYNRTLSVKQESRFEAVEFKGDYAGNSKTGNWVYGLKSFTPVNEPLVNDYSVVYEARGTEKSIQAEFDNDRASGEWISRELKVDSGQVVDTLFTAKANFLNGGFAGGFEGGNAQLKMTGQFSSEGLLNGIWSFEHENCIEEREFDNGVMIQHRFKVDNNTYELNYISVTTEDSVSENRLREVEVSRDYFKILTSDRFRLNVNEGSEKNTDRILSWRQLSNENLSAALQSFQMESGRAIWNQLPGSDSIQNPRVKLILYPYDNQEQEHLKSIERKAEASLKTIREFYEDAQVDISRHSYEDIAYYFAVFKRYKPILEKVVEVAGKFNSKSFRFINRAIVFPEFFNDDQPESEIQFEFDDQKMQREHDFPDALKSDAAYHNEWLEFTSSAAEDVSRINAEVDKILEKYKKEKRLKEVEEKLVKAGDTVLALYKGEIEGVELNNYHKQAAEKVILFVENTYRNYGMESTENRLKSADSIMTCFKNLVNLFRAQDKLPGQLNRLDELYTRTVWNPYTMTDMEERLKERIYNAFEKDVLPGFLNRLVTEVNCYEVSRDINEFEKIYRLMVKLREQDTKDTERQLKKASGSKERAELLLNLIPNRQ